MIDPGEIRRALVEKIRTIPEMTEEMLQDVTRIAEHLDAYPSGQKLVDAIHMMPAPGILVAWAGTDMDENLWRHRFSLYLRSASQPGVGPSGERSGGFSRLFWLLVEGVPDTGEDLAMKYATIHSGCLPFDVEAQRMTDDEGLDYFDVTLSMTEKGDYTS